MYRVVNYYDLRPIDWASGKRLPLEPGAGHVCDRCGAEHAVVYVVEDSETGGTYRVGSSCAKAQFGFEVEGDPAARDLVKSYKAKVDEEVNNQRLAQAAELAAAVAAEVRRLRPPEMVVAREVPARYPLFEGQLMRIYRAGEMEVDARQRRDRGWDDREARELASYRWLSHEIESRLPREWSQITAYQDPRHRRRTTDLFGLTARLVWEKLRH